MRLRTSDAPDGEGGNKWQRTGINDGLLTPIAPAAEAVPVSSPEGRGRFLSDQWLRFSFLQRPNERSFPHLRNHAPPLPPQNPQPRPHPPQPLSRPQLTTLSP